MFKKLFLPLSVLLHLHSISQSSDKPKKTLYFSWGYTRAVYSKSSIHMVNLSNAYNEHTGRNDYYDFTVHNATAHDRPNFEDIASVNVTVPQYVFRVGMNLNKKWGIELNYDHTKYVVDDHQRVHVEGIFNDRYVNQDTILDPQTFLHFEHSDGANFWMINAVRRWPLMRPRKNFKAELVIKPGVGVVIPRTDVTLFGERLNNNWKVAGTIAALETGLRVSFLKRGFFEFVGKGAFADYMNSFVLGKHHGKASHQFFSGQVTATIGLRLFDAN